MKGVHRNLWGKVFVLVLKGEGGGGWTFERCELAPPIEKKGLSRPFISLYFFFL